MHWYQNYIDDAKWQAFYEKEARRKLSGVISDWENCHAEAVMRLTMEKLPKATLSHSGNRDGYVASAYRSILIDIQREHCGRPRAPTLMKKAGPPIPKIFELHCLLGWRVDDISLRLQLPETDVKSWAAWLDFEQKCPRKTEMVSTTQTSEEGEYTMDLPDSDCDDPVSEHQTQLEQNAILEMILDIGKPESALQESLTNSSNTSLPALAAELQLTDQERLVLRLRFVEGLSKSIAAKQLSITPATLKKVEDELMQRLRMVFKRAGFGI